LHFFVPKVFSENQKWTFINVQFWKRRIFYPKKIRKIRRDHKKKLWVGKNKKFEKVVTINFFLKNPNLGGTFASSIAEDRKVPPIFLKNSLTIIHNTLSHCKNTVRPFSKRRTKGGHFYKCPKKCLFLFFRVFVMVYDNNSSFFFYKSWSRQSQQ